MFPEDDLTLDEIETLSNVKTTMGKVFLFDFETKQYIRVNGKPVLATYEQAIMQWITFMLSSNKEKIYQESNFALNLNQFIGNRAIDRYTAEAEIERLLNEKIVLHPEISAVEDINIERDGSKTIISMTVVTNQGIINGAESVVII
ncbi:hypothetical protein D3C75_456190 [compost metagenome]